ncbi:hypothetical protein JCM10207_003031 [Rhodosporidiobolus poonsookiae]
MLRRLSIPTSPQPAVNPGELSASNSQFEITLPLPDNRILTPGSTLRPVVRARGTKTYDSVSLRLVGEMTSTLMGKSRWQAGALIASDGFGTIVTSQQRHVFIDVEVPTAPLPGQSPTGDSAKDDAAATPLSPADGDVYEIEIPHLSSEHLLPASTKKHVTRDAVMQYDGGATAITWSLELKGIRKGLFKSNKSLTLELPVVFPSSPWHHAYDSTASTRHKLKYEGTEGSEVSVAVNLECNPPTTLKEPVHFTLTLSPSSAQAASLLSSSVSTSPIQAVAYLASQTRTSPLDNNPNGTNHTWPAVRIASGEMESLGAGSNGELQWRASVTAPPGEHTVQHEGLTIKYSVGCHVHSPVFADGKLSISLPVFLPSSPLDLDAGHAHIAEQGHTLTPPPYQPYTVLP